MEDLRVELAGALLKVFEGCKLTAYQDGGGIWTIGYGHTGPEVVSGMTISQQQANDLLAIDSKALFALVASRPPIEAAALVSFGYNCGAFALERVIAGQLLLTQCVHDSKGNVEPGLVSRRGLEEALIAQSQGLQQ